jgi:hypothetical protein
LTFDVLKAIGAAVIVLGTMHIRWVMIGSSADAMGVAARRGLSPWRIAGPYNRWGVDARCDIWTLFGAFIGVLLGLGLGWALIGSLPLGILLAGAGAVITGWRYRVVVSLLAVDRHAHDDAEKPLAAPGGARIGRVKLALIAVICAVVLAASWRVVFGTHGPTLVIGFVAAFLLLAWRLPRILRADSPS